METKLYALWHKEEKRLVSYHARLGHYAGGDPDIEHYLDTYPGSSAFWVTNDRQAAERVCQESTEPAYSEYFYPNHNFVGKLEVVELGVLR